MPMKKVYTMVPFCSINVSECAIKKCFTCDAAKDIKLHPMMVDGDTPVPINCGIDSQDIMVGEYFNLWVEYDKPIDTKKVRIICGRGLTYETFELSNRGTRVECAVKADINAIGNRNITISYNSVTRVFNVNIRKGYPMIIKTNISSPSIKVGEKLVVGYVLNRPLEAGDTDPTIVYDTEMFELIDTPKRSPINDCVYVFTLQAKSRDGDTSILLQYPERPEISISVNIYRDPDVEFATKEDIDGLFPELSDKPEEIPPIDPEPPLGDDVIYATEEDINSLFPELM